MTQKILLVEDDPNFGDVLSSYLEMQNFDVTLATDGEKGLVAFKKSRFDLCILDVMMPKKDGFTLGAEIRELSPDVPLIFVTAKTMKEDILQGFKVGADDYINKPFNSEELLLRIQAVLKRSTRLAPEAATGEALNEYNIGKYRFCYSMRTLSIDGNKIEEKLSPKEADLLQLFCQSSGNVLSRSEALKKVWGEDNYFTARSMDVFVSKLRKYFREDPRIDIQNIHGNGFLMTVKETA